MPPRKTTPSSRPSASPAGKSAPATRAQTLELFVKDINKTYGDGTAVRASDIIVPDRMTTGSFAFDCALGGGWPVNQWHEIIGESSAGKTATILKTIAANQEIDPDFHAIWIAAEYFDKGYARMLGVNTDRVLVVNERIMENAFEITLNASEKRVTDLCVIDSLPAMTPGEEAEKAMDEFTTAMGARLTNKFFRKQGTSGRRSMIDPDDRPFTGFLINQWRSKIGVMFGDPRTTPGGKGKDFACFTRVEIKRAEWLSVGVDKKKVAVGQIIQAQTLKNKSFPPRKVATFPFYFEDSERGAAGSYDVPEELTNMALAYDLLEKNGNWYSYGELAGNGGKQFAQVLSQDPAGMQALRQQLLALTTQKQLALRDVDMATLPTAGVTAAPRRRVVRPRARAA
jgi:recombination protein RecA